MRVFTPFTLKKSRAVSEAKTLVPDSGRSRNVGFKISLLPGPLKKMGLLNTNALTKLLFRESWLSLSF
jgi:hypothetical protein